MGLYTIYTSKPGDAKSQAWRWALTEQGHGLTRAQAARLGDALKAGEPGLKVICYVAGAWRYTR